MSIDTSGEYWVGSEPRDLDEYLRAFTADNYPASRFVHAKCAKGHSEFRLEVDEDEGVARRSCRQCGTTHDMLDSAEYWEDAQPRAVECPCGHDQHNVAVGFSLLDDGSIRWVTIAVRCIKCGVLGAPVDWKIDYEPAEHLFDAV